MNQHLKQLVSLSDLDREIDGFGPKEEEINSNLNSILGEQNSHSAQIALLETEIEENKIV